MSDQRNRYTWCETYDSHSPKGRWEIVDMGDKGYVLHGEDKVVWQIENSACTDDDCYPPREVRAEYERLIGYDPTKAPPPSQTFNLVEAMQGPDDDCAFDQPCAYGHRVDGHAVYCHNDWWLYAPRKCRRTWYTGGEVRDEDCEGFRPNGAKAS